MIKIKAIKIQALLSKDFAIQEIIFSADYKNSIMLESRKSRGEYADEYEHS